MAIRITGTLTPVGDFPVCIVADVQDAASETYADTAAETAVAAIPDASGSVKGLATPLQISKLDSVPSDAQSESQVEALVSAGIAAIPDASTLVRGLATTTQVTKLNGIPSDATSVSTATGIADASAASAVAAIPDATTLVRGMATTAQVSKLAGIPADAQSASQVTVSVNAVRYGAPRIYATCAAVRGDSTAPTYNPGVCVVGRGVFYWTTDAGTDTNDELTAYIAGSGGGFRLSQDLYRDYTPMLTPPAYQAYRVYAANNSLNLMTEFSDVTIQIGEETQASVYNGELVQINNGQAVYVSGSQGQRPKVARAINGNDEYLKILGLATHNIGNHDNGRVTTFGLVRDIATNSFNAGDEVYTSGTAGVLTATVPPGDVDGACLGVVMVSHPNDGSIFVSPKPFPRLASATANLPVAPRVGEHYLDTTLGFPVWWNGSSWMAAFPAGYTDIIGTVDQATASAALTYEEYRDTPAIYSFLRHDQNDACTLKYQTPHNWTKTAVEPHVHVIPCGNVTGVLVLDGYVAWSRFGTQALPALSSWTPFRVETTIQGTSQWISQPISLGSYTPPAGAAYPSAVLHVYLRRPGSSDSADTYTASKPDHTAAANVMLEFADCHVQIRGFGTVGLYS